MRRCGVGQAVVLAAIAIVASARAAHAQSDAELVVPPPPVGSAPPPPSQPQAPPGAPSPAEIVVAPLLGAAEQDIVAGSTALALARASIVRGLLPEGVPLRVRADGLALLAQQRLPTGATPSPVDEVLAPLVVQAELDLRAGQVPLAMARLDLALSRLPPGSPLHQRAVALRGMAGQAPAQPPPMMYGPPLGPPIPIEPPRPVDPNQRGVGEAIEFYIMAGGLGALTGAYIVDMASAGTAEGITYLLTTIGGAGVFAVGALVLDLTGSIRTGIEPTISSSTRFGFAHGLLAWGLYEQSTVFPDRGTSFSLVWGGTVIGALAGLGVGFGLTPSVREERFVESAGIWGGAIATYIAMLAGYEDTVGFGMTMGGLDVGLLIGIAMASAGVVPSTARTLWLDLAFLAGSGFGALVTLLGYAYSDSAGWEVWPFGLGPLIGSVGAWTLTFLLTGHLDAEESNAEQTAPQVQVGLMPVEGGAAASVSGTF
jgi:hypothetical protein